MFIPTKRGLVAAALAVAVVPFATGTASAAQRHHRHTATKTVAAAAPATAAPAATPQPTVTSVIAIGGYVFYNLTYPEAVAAWQAAVAAAPPGYTPPPVYSVSVDTTVSGTVPGDG